MLSGVSFHFESRRGRKLVNFLLRISYWLPLHMWFNKHVRKRGQSSAVPKRSPNFCHSPGNDYKESKKALKRLMGETAGEQSWFYIWGSRRKREKMKAGQSTIQWYKISKRKCSALYRCFYFFKLHLIAYLLIYIMIKALSCNPSFAEGVLDQHHPSSFPTLPAHLASTSVWHPDETRGEEMRYRQELGGILNLMTMSIGLTCFRGKWNIMTPLFWQVCSYYAIWKRTKWQHKHNT